MEKRNVSASVPPEIIVTPEMIQEGVRVFLNNLHDRVPPDWVLAPIMVTEVYLAMSRLRSQDSPSPTKCAQPGPSRDES